MPYVQGTYNKYCELIKPLIIDQTVLYVLVRYVSWTLIHTYLKFSCPILVASAMKSRQPGVLYSAFVLLCAIA